MLQTQRKNMKNWSSSVDTRSGSVDTRDLPKTPSGLCWDSVSTLVQTVSTLVTFPELLLAVLGQCVDTTSSSVDTSGPSRTKHMVRYNKLGHMKGECPKNKKEKYKKINKFKKPKAMVATWSYEDPSENEEEKSSSSESEEICFMANKSDGKVGRPIAAICSCKRQKILPCFPLPAISVSILLSSFPPSLSPSLAWTMPPKHTPRRGARARVAAVEAPPTERRSKRRHEPAE
ncbi:hypothetical protein Taro_040425 [Colocasia esculenta]|uniref:Uncharacterized protein n=1 Tax=Colocasia esculenta TaxID=4460 RepID=A0A843WUJ0_COLES|nr:hypothetical protein [Colocasia esculenta]